MLWEMMLFEKSYW